MDPLAASFQGADRVSAFRVHYILQGVPMYEYRYRLAAANAVANLVISARDVQGMEPVTLHARGQAITEKQVARLNSARQ